VPIFFNPMVRNGAPPAFARAGKRVGDDGFVPAKVFSTGRRSRAILAAGRAFPERAVNRSCERLVRTIMVLAGLCSFGPDPALAAEMVRFAGYRPGTIVVKTGERRLYYVIDRHRALRYPVGVGRRGKQWSGDARILAKYIYPDWIPPPAVRRDNPSLPAMIPPGPRNPLGARALALSRRYYAIHGTNQPNSVGGFVSYGCIRMYNQDIVDLFDRVQVGARVIVLP
jgi:lipoprotein-anchoring transpeptidase ErfK/SrfK